MSGFLIGLILGVAGTLFLTLKSSKALKEQKKKVEEDYRTKVLAIEEDRNRNLALLDAAKKKIEELTAEEAKLRLSLEAQERIEKSNEDVVSSTTNAIVEELKKRSKT